MTAEPGRDKSLLTLRAALILLAALAIALLIGGLTDAARHSMAWAALAACGAFPAAAAFLNWVIELAVSSTPPVALVAC